MSAAARPNPVQFSITNASTTVPTTIQIPSSTSLPFTQSAASANTRVQGSHLEGGAISAMTGMKYPPAIHSEIAIPAANTAGIPSALQSADFCFPRPSAIRAAAANSRLA